ncbi:MAG: hypothetical protein SOY64_03275 [Pyramidobacter sp.]|uniref:hypothetical protein n=1 Tax=Pyramidobacter sp. TaxID=1943581 RepID=UPI002A81BAD8|nr:hypothetical protein [Pyramidobacter sp.]MDY4032075.1 hypothetical protein [Pyramidobacter sp.]
MTVTEYNDRVHLLGRVTIFICIVALIAVPVGLAAYYGVQVAWGTLFEITVSPFITYLISSIIGLLALVPIIGGGALYVANVTGNVNNVKAPAAINGMDICEVEPGTEKGDVVALIAVCVTSIISTLIMVAGMIFLAPIFKPMYESEFFSPAFGVILPALYGALLTPYFMKGIKENIVPFLMPIVLIMIMGSKLYGRYSSYIMLGMMVLSVAYVWFLHKGDAETEDE